MIRQKNIYDTQIRKGTDLLYDWYPSALFINITSPDQV